VKVLANKKDNVGTIIINRAEIRNAVDRETASQLFMDFDDFEING
jgi:enoyl-CoA hydratase